MYIKQNFILSNLLIGFNSLGWTYGENIRSLKSIDRTDVS